MKNIRLIILALVVMLAVLPFSGCLGSSPPYPISDDGVDYCNKGSGNILPKYFVVINETCGKNYTCWVGYLSDGASANSWHAQYEGCVGYHSMNYPPSSGTVLTVVDPEGPAAGKCYWWDQALGGYNITTPLITPSLVQCKDMIEKHMLGWPFNYTLWVEVEIIDSFTQNFECGWGATEENYNWCAERYHEIMEAK